MMKKLLVLNHFPTVLPPTSGGTLRYFHIYEELSRFYDVTLLSQTFRNKGGLFNYSSSFREYKVAKDNFYNKIVQELQHNEITYEFALIIQTELAKHPTLFKKHFESLYPSSDVIFHESPFLLNYDSYIGKDQKPRVYNSHNHEFMLADQIWKNKTARSYLPAVFDLEKKLVKCADLVFSTSSDERNHFARMYSVDSGKVKLSPNGIHPDGWLPRKEGFNKKTLAYFIGADYPPNVEAVGYIVDHLADRCPEMDFLIGGGCCSPFSKTLIKPNIRLLGRVRHNQKIKLLADADVAINPMFTGAGVNLKTLEYLSAGIPLFSTHCGVRGLDLIDKKHYIHADKIDFASKLNQYAGDQSLLRKVAARGQKFVNEHYSWKSIVHRMKGDIDKLLF